MKKIIILPLLILLCPIYVSDPRALVGLIPEAPKAVEEQPPLQAIADYKQTLTSRGQSLDDQGVLIETLDRGAILAEHNPEITFNPASVMKLATSLVALTRFTPDHRYRTNFLADGVIDTSSRKLEGDLVVEGNCDPMFSAMDAQEVAAQLSRLGVSRVTGNLRIAGPFYYFATGYTSNLSRETSAAKLRTAIERSGIKIEGGTVFGDKTGEILISHYSDELVRILLYQNAHSSNAIAEVIGESVGGPEQIQSLLVRKLGLRDSEIYVGRASGLDFNRVTPRATLKIMRALLHVLAGFALKPEDVMPVAGIDSGTLRVRLHDEKVRGSVVAKTGTLVSMDSGVSTLVGVAYTRSQGPLLFAIFNSAGNVNAYRRLQDQLVEAVIAEEGGPVPVSRQEDALADTARRSIVQVLYRPQARPVESAAD